jgi:cation diffusion facilitator CzcD-associated flavoprotein CzcO
LHTADAEYALDAIVFATGFDAMTGAMKEIDIRTDAGLSIQAKWEDGPRTYLGIMMAGFPNLFMITGPLRPGVKSQMILACEQHVDWIASCIQHLRDRGLMRIEAEQEAEGFLGAARQRGGGSHALPNGQLVVCRSEYSRKAACLYAVCWRRYRLQKEVRRGCGQRL